MGDLTEGEVVQWVRANADLAALNPGLLPSAEPEPKPRKYHNEPTEYRGRVYASVREATRARELDLLQKAGEILCWFPQVHFELQAGVCYIADFVVLKADWSVEVEDVKGVRTRDFVIKSKLFAEKFKRKIIER